MTKEVATKSFVLLENNKATLPLSKAESSKYSVAVVGPFADCQACYYGKYSPHRDVNLTTTVAAGLQAAGSTVHVASGCSQKHKSDGSNPMYRGGGGGGGGGDGGRAGPGGCGCASCPCPAGAGPEPYMCTEYNKTAVVAAVAASNVCVIAVGLGANVESEGRDREAAGLALPGQQNTLVADAIVAAKARGIPIIALLFVAGPVDPVLFAEADAVVDCFYPAESTGLAVADVLFGTASPAGRLPFSWPTTAMDVAPEAASDNSPQPLRVSLNREH